MPGVQAVGEPLEDTVAEHLEEGLVWLSQAGSRGGRKKEVEFIMDTSPNRSTSHLRDK